MTTSSLKRISRIAAVFSLLALCAAQASADPVRPGMPFVQASALAAPAAARTAGEIAVAGPAEGRFAAETATPADTVAVTFEIKNCNTVMGQNVYVIGNIDKLGIWQANKAFPLAIEGSGANVPWKGTINLPAGTAIQYKYILWDGKTVSWESAQKTPSGNREVVTPASGNVTYDDGNFLNVPHP